MKAFKIILAIVFTLIAWFIGTSLELSGGADGLGTAFVICTMGAFIIAFCDKDK